MSTQLYRHFNSKGALMYVGISMSVAQRLAQHKLNSAWFDDIANITIAHFATREQAVEAEAEAIRSERPAFNTAHNKDNPHFFLGAPSDPKKGSAAEVPALDDWFPLPAFAEKHPTICSIPVLRWQLRHREENGLASAVTKSGRQLLISESRYAKWLASQAGT